MTEDPAKDFAADMDASLSKPAVRAAPTATLAKWFPVEKVSAFVQSSGESTGGSKRVTIAFL